MMVGGICQGSNSRNEWGRHIVPVGPPYIQDALKYQFSCGRGEDIMPGAEDRTNLSAFAWSF